MSGFWGSLSGMLRQSDRDSNSMTGILRQSDRDVETV